MKFSRDVKPQAIAATAPCPGCSVELPVERYWSLGKAGEDPVAHQLVDVDESLQPDFVCNLLHDPLPPGPWPAILADPPYSREDCANYSAGADNYPDLGLVGKRAWACCV